MQKCKYTIGVLLQLEFSKVADVSQHTCINFIPSISTNWVKTAIKKTPIIAEVKVECYLKIKVIKYAQDLHGKKLHKFIKR